MQNTQIPSHSLPSTTSTMLDQTHPFIARIADLPVTHGPGENSVFLLGGEQTDGRLVVTSTEVAVNAGPPPHVHGAEDEIFIVQSGTFELLANGEVMVAKAGDVAYMARGEAHRFRGLDSGEPNRFNIIVAPSGFENFMARWVRLFENGEPDMAQAVSLCSEYNITLYPSDEAAPPVPAQPHTKVVVAKSQPHLSVLGTKVTVLLTADDTQGRYSMVRVEASYGAGPPPHIHEYEDEMFIIESGRIEITLDDDVVVAEAGDAIWAPRGHLHTFRVISDEASMCAFMTPGGLDGFFVECAELEASGAITPAAVVDVSAKFGMNYPGF